MFVETSLHLLKYFPKQKTPPSVAGCDFLFFSLLAVTIAITTPALQNALGKTLVVAHALRFHIAIILSGLKRMSTRKTGGFQI